MKRDIDFLLGLFLIVQCFLGTIESHDVSTVIDTQMPLVETDHVSSSVQSHCSLT